MSSRSARRVRRLVSAAPARRGGRLPVLQRLPGLDLHGRHGQPVPGHEPRRRFARKRRARRRRAIVRSSRGCGASPDPDDPDPRHDAGHACHGCCLAVRPSQGGRDHSSHRLVAIGLSERRAVAVLWATRRARWYLRLLHSLARPGLFGAHRVDAALGHDRVYGLPDESSCLRRTGSQSACAATRE